jgi:hypothetical protein
MAPSQFSMEIQRIKSQFPPQISVKFESFFENFNPLDLHNSPAAMMSGGSIVVVVEPIVHGSNGMRLTAL